jgi:hypothetical protein
MKVFMMGTGTMDIPMCGVRPTSRITVDPLQPVLCTMTCRQILEIIRCRNALRLGCPQEIVFDRVCVVPEADLDGALETVDVTVVAGSL